MASLLSNATRIAGAKVELRQSIENKNVEVSEDLKIEDYSSKIDLIKQGIEEGTYNIEVYVRIDNVLIGEGVEFEVVGTDGTKTAATSRAGGYVFLTLNYGVGYDMQPKDQAAYYAESHPLIYHLKDEGNYFATDYYFTTAQAGGGDEYDICNLSSAFSTTKTNGIEKDVAYYNRIKHYKNAVVGKYPFTYYTSSGVTTYLTLSDSNDIEMYKDFASREFTEITNASYFYANIRCNKEITIDYNVNFPKATTIEYLFYGSGKYCSDQRITFNINIKNLQNCTNFNNAFNTSSQFDCYINNLDMSKCTKCSSMFSNIYIKKITFNGSFGGNSTTSSLTLDLSPTSSITIEILTEMLESISENTNGKTRIFKLPSTLYNSLTEDILLLAAEKGYTLSS